MNLVDSLKARRGFTSAESSVADYILHHAEGVPRMTVGELSEKSHVSKAAIIRLCHKLGLDGYRELRVELAAELERRRSHLADIDVNRPFTEHESCATTLRLVAELEREAIDACYQSISPELIETLAHEVVEAQRVVIYAVGDSCLVASLFASKLSKLGIACINAGLYADYAANTAIAAPGDLALLVTYSGLLLRGVLANGGIHPIIERGCRTAVVTGLSEEDPLVRDADYVVSFQRLEAQKGAIGSFYSLTCMGYILNCIYARVYAHDFERYDRSKAMVDDMNRRSLGEG